MLPAVVVRRRRCRTFTPVGRPGTRVTVEAGSTSDLARSALDHLAVHTDARGALLAGKEYGDEDERRVQFPITTSPGDFREMSDRRLSNAQPEALEIIGRFQPYKVSISPHMAHIRLVSELDNVDKHRSIAPIGFTIRYAVTDWPAETYHAPEHPLLPSAR